MAKKYFTIVIPVVIDIYKIIFLYLKLESRSLQNDWKSVEKTIFETKISEICFYLINPISIKNLLLLLTSIISELEIISIIPIIIQVRIAIKGWKQGKKQVYKKLYSIFLGSDKFQMTLEQECSKKRHTNCANIFFSIFFLLNFINDDFSTFWFFLLKIFA